MNKCYGHNEFYLVLEANFKSVIDKPLVPRRGRFKLLMNRNLPGSALGVLQESIPSAGKYYSGPCLASF